MRLKLFFFPTALLITVIMSIWYIYPLWRGQGGIADQSKRLKQAQENLNVFREKKQSLNRAVDLINEHSKDAEFAFNYIPFKRSDLLMVNSLGKIAADSGLFLVSLQVKTDDSERNKSINKTTNTKPLLERVNWHDANISVNLLGDYGQLKGFLSKLYYLNMFNEVTALDISNISESKGGEQPENLDSLDIKMTVNFKYLPEITLKPQEDQEFFNDFKFSENYFDFLSISSLKERNNVYAGGGDLRDGITGQTSNPFSPLQLSTQAGNE